jgi:cytochrome o ubiquinol oxidase subunit 1
MSAPPPEYNFAVLPQVEGRYPFFDLKRAGRAYREPLHYEPITVSRESALGPVIGIAGAAAAFALVWHMWWLAALGLLAVVGAVIARSFARDVDRVIPAEEVRRREQAWLAAAHEALPIPRRDETKSVNHGLAEVEA